MKREFRKQHKIMFVNIDAEKVKAYALVLKGPLISISFYSEFDSAYKAVKKERPDLIVFDPPGDGDYSHIMGRIYENYPETDFVVLTGLCDSESIISAFREGASGYLLYNSDLIEIVQGIREVLEGGTVMSKPVSACLVKSFQLAKETPLTRREQDVLHELSTGKSYRYIAEALSVSIDTVRSHVQNIFEKLDVRNKSEAVIKAKQNRLV